MENFFHEIKYAHDYMETLKSYGNANMKELEFSKQRKVYEKLKEEILETKIPNINNLLLQDPSLSKELTEEIIQELFPEFFISEDIEDFISRIKIDRKLLFAYSDCVTKKDKRNEKLEAVYIYSYQSTTNIPMLANALSDSIFFQANYTANTFGNFHYKKTPGLTLEKIIGHIAEQEYNLPFKNAIDMVRVSDLKEMVATLLNLESVSHKIPKNSDMEEIYQFHIHSTLSLIVGDIYGEALFRKYLFDEHTFLLLFHRLLKQEITFEDLLNYYDISLQKPEIKNLYQKRLTNIQQKNC